MNAASRKSFTAASMPYVVGPIGNSVVSRRVRSLIGHRLTWPQSRLSTPGCSTSSAKIKHLQRDPSFGTSGSKMQAAGRLASIGWHLQMRSLEKARHQPFQSEHLLPNRSGFVNCEIRVITILVGAGNVLRGRQERQPRCPKLLPG